MRNAAAAACVFVMALAACSPSGKAPTGKSTELSSPANWQRATATADDTPLKEFMGHVMDRNASQLWSWTTYLSDAQGDHYTQPQTEKDWINAESDALTMVQLSYLLESPSLAVDDEKWAAQVARFRKTAKNSADAAESKNFAKLETAASDMNRACVACHVTYVPQIEGPYQFMNKALPSDVAASIGADRK